MSVETGFRNTHYATAQCREPADAVQCEPKQGRFLPRPCQTKTARGSGPRRAVNQGGRQLLLRSRGGELLAETAMEGPSPTTSRHAPSCLLH